MDTLASSVDERVFKLLRNLVKLVRWRAVAPLASGNNSKYKELYRVGLRAKMTAKVETEIFTMILLDATVLRLFVAASGLEIQKGLVAHSFRSLANLKLLLRNL
jgi:hypothetical protein